MSTKIDPVHQFQIHEIVNLNLMGVDISITNQSIWMLGIIGTLSLVLLIASTRLKTVPGRGQAMLEMVHDLILGTLKDSAGAKGVKYMPFIFTLFLFLLVINLAGMVPGSFTSTSQIYITGFMSFFIFLSVIVIGFATHGLKFLKLFTPAGIPMWMMPFIVVLEVLSFFVRPFTLAIRLCANMMAGHIVVKLFAYFITMMLGSGILVGIFSVLPFAGLIGITALEVFVAAMQAYIFTLLTCVYLNDALNMH
ncbi:MAG: F-type H+-transporting ATPase subunit a [Alphaproteobacteria bacterium]|jgi:F-type H+-transporting ATPase subunit a